MEGDKSVKIEKLLENADKRIQFLKNRWISLEFEVFALRASFSLFHRVFFRFRFFLRFLSKYLFIRYDVRMCMFACLRARCEKEGLRGKIDSN